MAVVDARYRFLLVDIGRPGSESDGGILSRSEIGLSLEKGTLGFPPSKSLPGTSKEMPFVIVGDEAFPLKTYLMKPYPKVDINKDQNDEGKGEALKKRVFNYRLSRARRVSENAFGILSNRWRIFRRTFKASEKNTVAYIGACVALHNFLLSEVHSRSIYCLPALLERENDKHLAEGPSGAENTEGRTVLQHLPRLPSSAKHDQPAAQVRNDFADYFSGQGSVKCQNKIVTRAS